MNTFAGKDHTIHSRCEGLVKFTREFIGGKYRSTIHVIPCMNYNKKTKYPKPFIYHPEQFPELAEYNPKPSQWKVTDTAVANLKKAKVDKVLHRNRKLYKHCTDFEIEEFLTTSKEV